MLLFKCPVESLKEKMTRTNLLPSDMKDIVRLAVSRKSALFSRCYWERVGCWCDSVNKGSGTQLVIDWLIFDDEFLRFQLAHVTEEKSSQIDDLRTQLAELSNRLVQTEQVVISRFFCPHFAFFSSKCRHPRDVMNIRKRKLDLPHPV